MTPPEEPRDPVEPSDSTEDSTQDAAALREAAAKRTAWLKLLPNRLTLLRIGAIPLLLILYPLQFRPLDVLCGVIFFAAVITDALDGYLARRFKAVTPLGKLLDPIADKMLIAATLVLLANVGTVPAFLAGLLICRDIGVSGLRLVAMQENMHIAVSDYGKWKTIAQGFALFCLLMGRQIQGAPNLFGVPFFEIGMVALWIALLLSFYSAWLYGKSFIAKAKSLQISI